jgi:5-methylcytosine-specific restriction protein A
MTLTTNRLKAKCACGTKTYPSEAAADRALAKIQALRLRDVMPKRVVQCWHGQWHLEGVKHVDTGPDRDTRQLVMERDDWTCAFCGRPIREGQDYSLQHRKARGSGGTSDPAVNSPANLVLVDGSATTGCHFFLESRKADAEKIGFVISKNSDIDPATVAISHALYGPVLLLDDGTWVPDVPLGGAA